MTALPSQEKFAEQVRQAFFLGLPNEEKIELTLTEVCVVSDQAIKQAQEAGRSAPFSILFLGPVEPLLPQGLYQLSNSTLGTHHLFLVPLGSDSAGTVYEAVFN